jgi:hypothetical protein
MLGVDPMTKKPPEGNSQTTPKSKGQDEYVAQDEYVVGYCKPPIEYQFKPGQGGPRRGSRNKLGEDFLHALAEDFERHGVEAIERVRIEKPEAYLKVIATLMPKDLNLNVRQLDDLSDEQLMRKLQQVTELAKPLLAKLPTVIGVTHVGVDVGVDSKTAADTPDKSST